MAAKKTTPKSKSTKKKLRSPAKTTRKKVAVRSAEKGARPKAKKGKREKEKKKDRVHIRQAVPEDIPQLLELNVLSFPQMTAEGVTWGESHLLSHQRIFPEGQLVAEVGGRIVGACSTLIVDMGRTPLRHHTWSGITDSGYFSNHDGSGDTLYGAEVFVHPDARGEGVGAALYAARRKLCRTLNNRRILAGGRLWNYCDHADKMSPEDYAYRVAADELKDLVLSFQLREGFQLRGVMRHYIRDPRSHNCASLIEWVNPDYKASEDEEGIRKVRVACVQYQMRKVKSFRDFARQVNYFVDIAADYGADFVLLPELMSVQLLSATKSLTPQEGMKRLSEFTPRYVKLMKGLAKKFGLTIIAGSHPVRQGDRLLNVAYVCLPSGETVAQPKLHITPNERKWWNISGGNTLRAIDTPKARIGVQICYDVEFPEQTRFLSDQGAEIIFVPFCTDNRQGYLRVRYCAQARAIENQIYVAMAGNVGNLPDVNNMDIQYGQAAVLTPSDFAFARDGIASEADSNEETILFCDLDLDDLHRARTDGTVTPHLDRRLDLFRIVSTVPDPRDLPMIEGEDPLGDQPRQFADW
ncbi:MAG: bifunctional GNAT family N-acetyltransferase/carbon-nitrogen hydrolase family protein [Verrucomicrobiales bacterium]